MLIPKTDRNQNLFVPSVRPSPVEMEHVSTSPDNAKSGPLENGSPLLDTTSFDLTSYQVY
jgi:hypothetical protein